MNEQLKLPLPVVKHQTFRRPEGLVITFNRDATYDEVSNFIARVAREPVVHSYSGLHRGRVLAVQDE